MIMIIIIKINFQIRNRKGRDLKGYLTRPMSQYDIKANEIKHIRRNELNNV